MHTLPGKPGDHRLRAVRLRPVDDQGVHLGGPPPAVHGLLRLIRMQRDDGDECAGEVLEPRISRRPFGDTAHRPSARCAERWRSPLTVAFSAIAAASLPSFAGSCSSAGRRRRPAAGTRRAAPSGCSRSRSCGPLVVFRATGRMEVVFVDHAVDGERVGGHRIRLGKTVTSPPLLTGRRHGGTVGQPAVAGERGAAPARPGEGSDGRVGGAGWVRCVRARCRCTATRRSSREHLAIAIDWLG